MTLKKQIDKLQARIDKFDGMKSTAYVMRQRHDLRIKLEILKLKIPYVGGDDVKTN